MVTLFATVGCDCLAQDGVEDNGSEFQGIWNVVSIVADGQLVDDIEGTSWGIQGDRITAKQTGRNQTEESIVVIEIDVTKVPKHIEFRWMDEEKHVREIRKGIFFRTGDTWIVCLPDDDDGLRMNAGHPFDPDEGIKRILVDGKERRATLTPKNNVIFTLKRLKAKQDRRKERGEGIKRRAAHRIFYAQ